MTDLPEKTMKSIEELLIDVLHSQIIRDVKLFLDAKLKELTVFVL